MKKIFRKVGSVVISIILICVFAMPITAMGDMENSQENIVKDDEAIVVPGIVPDENGNIEGEGFVDPTIPGEIIMDPNPPMPEVTSVDLRAKGKKTITSESDLEPNFS